MEEALQQAIREQVLNDPEVGSNDHFLININSNRLRHSYHSSRMRVRNWLDNTLRVQEIMHNANFPHVELQRTVSIGRFLLRPHFSHSRSRPRGRQSEFKKDPLLKKLLDPKKSVVKIKNEDELCCTHAIVTMKALADANRNSRDQDYYNLKQGHPFQFYEKPVEDLTIKAITITYY